MTKHLFSQFLKKSTFVLSITCLIFINTAHAGICDISGGSGIGGTGSPMHGSGIGGTGAVAYNNGIGGTGKPIKKTGTGIGGTGFVINGSGIGGTGQPVNQNGLVVGTITGFGSICVNNIEIHYTSATPLQRYGTILNPESSLAIGQVVAVGVSGFGNEVTAKEMHILHAATGPISTIDFVKGEIEVIGQKVHFAPDLVHSSPLSRLQAGDYIEVSGLRNPAGHIVASRIDAIAKQETASLQGTVTSISRNSFDVQGIKVNTPAPSDMAVGQTLQITGKLDIHGFKADGLQVHSQLAPSADIGGLVSVEGYLNSSNNAARIEVAGRTIEIPVELQVEVKQVPEHERVIVTGHLSAGSIIQLEHMLFEIPSLDLNESHNEDSRNEQEDNKLERNSGPNEHKTSDVDDIKVEHLDEDEEFEAPEALEHEKPEADEFEAPEAPEFEAPEVPEFEAPEAPEYEAPEVPEFEAPEVPEFEAPEVPEYEAPEVPEFEAPEVPEYEAPEVPEFEAPEVPELDVPEYETPES